MSMKLEDLGPDALWHCYQRGYNNLIRSGLYFRQILRPVISHTSFQRAMPLLAEYAEANRTDSDLPPGFRDRLDACPLSPRDLLHLDYAICLGYAEIQGHEPNVLEAMLTTRPHWRARMPGTNAAVTRKVPSRLMERTFRQSAKVMVAKSCCG